MWIVYRFGTRHPSDRYWSSGQLLSPPAHRFIRWPIFDWTVRQTGFLAPSMLPWLEIWSLGLFFSNWKNCFSHFFLIKAKGFLGRIVLPPPSLSGQVTNSLLNSECRFQSRSPRLQVIGILIGLWGSSSSLSSFWDWFKSPRFLVWMKLYWIQPKFMNTVRSTETISVWINYLLKKIFRIFLLISTDDDNSFLIDNTITFCFISCKKMDFLSWSENKY